MACPCGPVSMNTPVSVAARRRVRPCLTRRHPDADRPRSPTGPERSARRAPPERLAARERRVMALMAQGRSTEEITARLCGSPLTVPPPVRRAMTRPTAHHRVQLVSLARQSGLWRAGPRHRPPGRARSGEPVPKGA
ncbi:LuxR C-terminal-related transcriptional regulator [Streptomyces sp. NPDC007905]|uniref:helix-turn-helix domain-containing protein n=1 Tax=Streptomyces sp. NPDC007905 TaxID=3364788 RepID=UPI0036F04F47